MRVAGSILTIVGACLGLAIGVGAALWLWPPTGSWLGNARVQDGTIAVWPLIRALISIIIAAGLLYLGIRVFRDGSHRLGWWIIGLSVLGAPVLLGVGIGAALGLIGGILILVSVQSPVPPGPTGTRLEGRKTP